VADFQSLLGQVFKGELNGDIIENTTTKLSDMAKLLQGSGQGASSLTPQDPPCFFVTAPALATAPQVQEQVIANLVGEQKFHSHSHSIFPLKSPEHIGLMFFVIYFSSLICSRLMFLCAALKLAELVLESESTITSAKTLGDQVLLFKINDHIVDWSDTGTLTATDVPSFNSERDVQSFWSARLGAIIKPETSSNVQRRLCVHDTSEIGFLSNPLAKIDLVWMDNTGPVLWSHVVAVCEIELNLTGFCRKEALGQLLDRATNVFVRQPDRQFIFGIALASNAIEVVKFYRDGNGQRTGSFRFALPVVFLFFNFF
jgi:hypothetical protein